MAEMGFKVYRFSISWSRIIPQGTGDINPKGIEYYNNVINECLKYDIVPLVTMFHFDMPAALDQRGSWSNPESVDWFLEFAKTMFENYEDILKGLKENLQDTKIVLLSMTAMGGEHWGSKNQLAAYNNVTIRLLAQKYGFTFVDLYTPLYDVSIREVYEGYTSDGGHLTHEGYTVVTAHVTPVLEELFGK
jgi:beta-glucosidase/6-phospho-beta-glucosidase/beta-galactosidase